MIMLWTHGIKNFMNPEPSLTAPENESGAITVTAVKLYNDYETDMAAADKLYTGKTIAVTGEVILSRGFFETYYIILGSRDSDDSFQFGVRCVFSANLEPFDPRLRDVKKYTTVTIRGVCQGYKTDVLLEQCTLEE
ncbi:MAG: hypothetical protein ABIB93_03800 [Chloroflexota bacterium]